MSALDLQSERYSPTGNLASTGAKNQLGRPKLDPITVLVRESVQNAWDARADRENGSVAVHFELTHAGAEQLDALCDTVFAERPREGIDLQRVAAGGALPLLTISDRGTVGLGGPTRADIVVDEHAPRDFVDFLRNLGEPPDRSCSGGTYGYGKASLYAVSRAGCILVDTQVASPQGLPERRFMGAGLGHPYVDRLGQSRCTGRHWWGRTGIDGIVEPLLNEEARLLAERLSLPRFAGSLGTNITIVDFDAGSRSPKAAMDLLTRAVLWNFWPKMIALPDGGVPMTFTAAIDGAALRIPRPDEHPTLRTYAKALRNARRCALGGQRPPDTFAVKCSNPNRHLGWLALVRDARTVRAGDRLDAEAGGLDVEASSHVALMRSAELVVRYLPTAPLQTDILHYGAVFVASTADEVDAAFSKSEPPTHDDWVVPQLTDPNQRTLVRVGLRRIQETVHSATQPAEVQHAPGSGGHLGGLSQLFGRILVGLPGIGGGLAAEPARGTRTGPELEQEQEQEVELEPDDAVAESPAVQVFGGDAKLPQPTNPTTPLEMTPASQPGEVDGPAPTRPPGKPRVRVSTPTLAELDGIAVLQLSVEVKSGVRSRGTRLTASACAVLDSGDGETHPPAGADVPSVYCWQRPDGAFVPGTGNDVEVETANDGLWLVFVRLIDDAEVRVQVAGEAVANP